MPSLSETLLAGGCARHIDAVHGERIQILNGPDAGNYFQAVIETENDQILATELGNDARAKIVMRFLGNGPQLGMTGQIKRDDGSKYQAVIRQEAGFLTQDYELTEIVADKDQA